MICDERWADERTADDLWSVQMSAVQEHTVHIGTQTNTRQDVSFLHCLDQYRHCWDGHNPKGILHIETDAKVPKQHTT